MDQFKMIQCNTHYDEKVEFLCLDGLCTAPRLFCFKCYEHQGHIQDCNKIDRNLIPFLKQCQEQKNELQNFIVSYQLKIIEKCEKLLSDINLKYNISLKMLNSMTSFQEKNEALSELLNLKNEQEQLLYTFENNVNLLSEEIDLLNIELKLDQFSYVKKVDEGQKYSMLLFQKANSISKDQQDKALELLEEALEFDPSNQKALNLQSQILSNKQQINKTEQLLEQTICLFNRGFYKESLNNFTELISKDSVDINQIYVKGQELRKQGKLEEAIQWYEKILETDPKHFNAIISKGEILLSLNKNSEALSFYDQQLNNFQDREEFRIGKCEALFQLKKHKEAIEYFSKNPIKKYLQKIKKNCEDLILQQCFGDAILWSKAILLIADTEQQFFTDCAQFLYNKGFIIEAEPWFEKAHKLQKNNFSAYYNYTYTLFKVNKIQEAYNIFCCMLEFNREDPQKYLHMAEELFKKQYFGYSYKWFQKFMQLGQQLFQQKNYSDSLKWAQLIAYSNKNYLRTFQLYAQDLEDNKKYDDANKWNEIFLLKTPENQKVFAHQNSKPNINIFRGKK